MPVVSTHSVEVSRLYNRIDAYDDDKIIASIAQTTRFLLKPEVSGVVGETVVVDGGAMMLP